jgi:hypothetical protein
LRLFLKEVPPFNNEELKSELLLVKATKRELLNQLRKANWANGELRRIAKAVADAIGDTNPKTLFSLLSQLVYLPGEGYLVTMEEAIRSGENPSRMAALRGNQLPFPLYDCHGLR